MRTIVRLLSCLLLISAACSGGDESTGELAGDVSSRESTLADQSTPPEEAGWPGGVAVHLDRGCGGASCSAPSLAVELENLRDENVQVAAFLGGQGLDGRAAQIRIDGLGQGSAPLKPGERRRFTIDASALPVQSVGTLSSVRAEVTVTDAAGTYGSISSDLAIEHDASYRTVLSYDEDGAAERARRIDPAVLLRPVGRVLVDGRLVDVTTLPPQGGKGYTLGGGSTTLEQAPAPQPWSPPPTGARVCFDLKVSYVDAGFGEDYVNAGASGGVPAVQAVSASYMRAWVKPAFALFKVWDGYLNAAGCTPQLDLDGSYVITMQSEVEKQAGPNPTDLAHYTVKLHTASGDSTKTWSRSFSISGTQVVTVTPSSWDRTQNVLGVVARMFVGLDNWVTPGTSTHFVDKGCPTDNPNIPPTDSCMSSGSVYVGPGDPPDKPVQSLNKFLVAHEFGHQVQFKNFAVGGFNYDAVIDPTHLLCRCDHVTSANGLHCIQSLEQYAAGFIEGFGHFYASKLFNSRSQSDCKFVYYKEISIIFGVLDPPMGVDCDLSIQWRDQYCSHIANSSTEMDFMRFLWRLYADGPNRLSADEIDALFTQADLPAGAMTWTHLHNAAAAVLGLGSAKYDNLVDLASEQAIDDDLGL